MLYIIILVLILLLSLRYDICGKKRLRLPCYYGMLLVFILVAGLRWRVGLDTVNYLGDFYHKIPTLDGYSFNVFQSPLFEFINSLVKTLGGRFYVVQFIHAAFINILIFKYITKHSSYIFTCLFFYAILCYTYYNMEIMRGSMSIAVCLFANDYIIEKKWVKGYLLYVFALMFHPQTILLFFLPFLFPILKMGYKVIPVFLAFYALGIIANELLSDYLFLLDWDSSIERKASNYMANEYYNSTNNKSFLYFVLKIFVPLLYSILCILYTKKVKRNPSLLKLEPLLILYICFLLFKSHFFIAYRYLDYYTIYICLLFSEFIVDSIKFSEKITLSVAYTRSFLVFIPIFLSTVGASYLGKSGDGFRYYPYNSVLQMNDESKRQHRINKGEAINYYTVHYNEY